jgi:hypothetical protein
MKSFYDENSKFKIFENLQCPNKIDKEKCVVKYRINIDWEKVVLDYVSLRPFTKGQKEELERMGWKFKEE